MLQVVSNTQEIPIKCLRGFPSSMLAHAHSSNSLFGHSHRAGARVLRGGAFIGSSLFNTNFSLPRIAMVNEHPASSRSPFG